MGSLGAVRQQNQSPAAASKWEIHSPAGQGLRRASSVQKQQSLITVFPFPTSSFSQRTCGFPLELALQLTSHIQSKFLQVS